MGKNDFQTMCGKKDSIFQRICWERAVFSSKLWAKERPCFCFCEKRPYIFERILQRLFGEKAQTHFKIKKIVLFGEQLVVVRFKKIVLFGEQLVVVPFKKIVLFGEQLVVVPFKKDRLIWGAACGCAIKKISLAAIGRLQA